MTAGVELAALVMAGGRGTRMAEHHPDVPKPLVRVAGLTLLEINLRQLQRLGVRDLFVAVHHQATQIADWLRTWTPAAAFDLRLLIETRPRGTIGSLADLRHLERPVLVSNGDLLSGIDLEHMVAFHRTRGADLTIATHTEQHRLKLGEVHADAQGRLQRYVEKPLKEYRISSGVYLWEPTALQLLPDSEWNALPDLVNHLVAIGRDVAVYHHDEPWLDVNDEADRVRAETLLRDDPIAFGVEPEWIRP